MSKTWETKRQIIQLLSSGNMNVTEIADKLGISQATASQHITELRSMGAIEEVSNEHIKKWKYYRANPNFNAEKFIRGENRMNGVGKIAIGVTVVVVIGLIVIGLTYGHTAPKSGNLVLSLTDPPQVPAGTTALMIAYSSVQAHVIGHNSSGWVNASGSGTLDLMQLINVSQVIGTAAVPNSSTVNMLRFKINSASIAINGTTYNVTVPSGMITAGVSGAVNGTTQAIIDFTPTVVAIYTNNSTVFVMVPSVRAVIVPGKPHSVVIGAKASLNESARAELEHVQPNMSITSTSLSMANNQTSFSVTLHNAANVPVQIKHISLFGNMSVTVSPYLMANAHVESHDQVKAPAMRANTLQQAPGQYVVNAKVTGIVSGSSGNLTVNGSMSNMDNMSSNSSSDNGIRPIFVLNNSEHGGVDISIPALDINTTIYPGNMSFNGIEAIVRAAEEHHIRVALNASNLPNANVLLNGSFGLGLQDAIDVGLQAQHIKALTFAVSSNGTLVLPFSRQEFEGNGYTMAPNSTATFSFTGPVVLGNGHIRLEPVVNDTYSVVVQGEDGARASVNVTAS